MMLVDGFVLIHVLRDLAAVGRGHCHFYEETPVSMLYKKWLIKS